MSKTGLFGSLGVVTDQQQVKTCSVVTWKLKGLGTFIKYCWCSLQSVLHRQDTNKSTY